MVLTRKHLEKLPGRKLPCLPENLAKRHGFTLPKQEFGSYDLRDEFHRLVSADDSLKHQNEQFLESFLDGKEVQTAMLSSIEHVMAMLPALWTSMKGHRLRPSMFRFHPSTPLIWKF
jgi:hypothetical protein